MNSQTLEAVLNTLVPAISTDEPGPAGDFLRADATQLGLDTIVSGAISRLPGHARGVIADLLEALSQADFAGRPLDERTAMLVRAGDGGGNGRFAVRVLKALAFGSCLGAVGPDGRNAVWDAVGYPGPVTSPPPASVAPKSLPTIEVRGDTVGLTADVCIVGSGAGGSVIAARLATAGHRVVVLEAGPYRTESDFLQLESAAGELYLGGGMLWSETGEMGLLAGSALGGGTVINSMVCLRTPTDIRREWADMGLEGIDGPEFDRITDVVWARLGVNTEATHYNENTKRMVAGLTACGYAHERIPRNAALEDNPELCGYCNWGCQQGCKRSTVKTYLKDAAAAGAQFVVGCRVDRITSDAGRATGVEGVVENNGGYTSLRVDAPLVIAAAGGIGTPALLLRSGIGGPAVGKNLRLHPAWIVTGIYPDPVNAWAGQIQSAVSFDLTHCESGAGFLVESLTLNPGFWASQTAFRDGRAHKLAMLKLPHMASWHAVAHDHGSGEVILDDDGEPLVRWRLDDDIDRRIAVRGHVELAKLHRAAGAEEVFTFHFNERRWRLGEDFDDYLEALRNTPAQDYSAFSAHQMSSCCMGTDPRTSVADCRGELHDVAGVWIGDASALPSAPGVNPMITIMALAERTASYIARQG